MAERQLPIDDHRRTVIRALLVCTTQWLTAGSAQAWGREPAVGMSLLFLNKGRDGIGVGRFDPDGRRGPVPGALGASPTEGKQLNFMPDDGMGVPKFVEVSWMVADAVYKEAWNLLKARQDKYSKQWMKDVDDVNAHAPQHTQRLDLTSLITPELLNKVRSDRQNTQLKLVVLFKDQSVTALAQAYAWRGPNHVATPPIGSPRDEPLIFANGYYVGDVDGAMVGKLSIGMATNGLLHGAINASDGGVVLLAGQVDNTQKQPKRPITLTGSSANASMTLHGIIDLQAYTLSGHWTLQHAPNGKIVPGGRFDAGR